jgi:hypothetical protein
MCEKQQIHQLFIQFINYVICNYLRSPRTTPLDKNTPIHNILSTAPQISISHKTLGTLPEGDNIMPKHVGTTIHNKLNE